MKPLILVIGPEGSGTTYIYRSLTKANPDLRHPAMKNGHAWPYSVFDKGPYPTWGIHHISLPAKRPSRWLDLEKIPQQARIIASNRNRQDAINSAHRRFGRFRLLKKIESRQYDRAISLLACYRETFETLDVRYEELGKQWEDIENFLGISGKWPPFKPNRRKR